MVNTVGLRKASILAALEKAAGVEFRACMLSSTSTLMMGSTRLHLTMRWVQVRRRRLLMS